MATSKINSGVTLYSKQYTTPSEGVVPAGDTISWTVGTTSNTGNIMAAYILNYNVKDLGKLIPYSTKWYSYRRISVYNPTSSSITIPAGTVFVYLEQRMIE